MMLNARYAGFTVACSHHRLLDADAKTQPQDDKMSWLTLSLRKREGLQPRTRWVKPCPLPSSSAEFLIANIEIGAWRIDVLVGSLRLKRPLFLFWLRWPPWRRQPAC